MSGQARVARPAISTLTSLRFFAAALVVANHFYFPTGKDWLSAIGRSGYQCVLFFFVLSGFVLVYAYSGASTDGGFTETARTFWRARIARIVPAYWLALAIGLPAFAYSALISHITPLSDFVIGLVLVPVFLESWWSPAALLWNAPAWSLSVEALFYASFPFLAARMAAFRLSSALLGAILLLVATSALRMWLTPEPDAPVEAWSFRDRTPLFHLGEFIFGMILGRIFVFGGRLPEWVHRAMFATGVCIALLLMAFRFSIPGWMIDNTTFTLVFGLAIYGAAGSGHVPVLSGKALVTLGEASYGLYILHMPLLFFWNQLNDRLHIPNTSAVDFWVYFIAATGFSVGVFFLWENPMRRRLT